MDQPGTRENKIFPEAQDAKHYDENKGDTREAIKAAIDEHVIGQRVTNVEVERKLDLERSKKAGQPIDMIEMAITLENNVAYIFRVYAYTMFVEAVGEGLATVTPDDEDETPACSPESNSNPSDSAATKTTGEL